MIIKDTELKFAARLRVQIVKQLESIQDAGFRLSARNRYNDPSHNSITAGGITRTIEEFESGLFELGAKRIFFYADCDGPQHYNLNKNTPFF